MYVWGCLSKQNGESIWNIVIPCVVGGAGLLMDAESLATRVLATASFCVAGLGLYAAIPAFWGVPPTILGGQTATSGLAFTNAIGSVLHQNDVVLLLTQVRLHLQRNRLADEVDQHREMLRLFFEEQIDHLL